ncbi:MAG: M23 family metallopeptidase [Nanoarchaeota archaeon]|nr:M23 family metallopeptidase [Nanoarchaeota archaeon]
MRLIYGLVLVLLLFTSCAVKQEINCDSFSVYECPDACVRCGSYKLSSLMECHTKEFCENTPFEPPEGTVIESSELPFDAPNLADELNATPINITENNDSDEQDENLWDEHPVLYDIGINIEPLDSRTKKAGDLDFRAISYSDKMFLEFGGDEGDGSLNPHPMFVLPLGTEIHAVSDGLVNWIKPLGDDDYDMCIYRSENDPWCVSYEHIADVRVKEGDKVKVGDVLGKVGRINDFTNFGKFDLKVWHGGATILNHCPYDLLHESVREERLAEISNLVMEWEDYIHKDVYNEDDWLVPGCAMESMTE